MRLLLILALTAGSLLAEGPRITYSKFFKGSQPELVLIALDKNGAAVYREAKDDPNPLEFHLTTAQTAEIFALAAKLDLFKRPLESGLKVANMGMKTFQYEDGAVKNEVKFNYSLDLDARSLEDWFERMAETEGNYIDLDRTAHFDKLGVNDALLQLQETYEHKRLVAPDQFIPLLQRIVKNESYLHMARERAAQLIQAFGGQPVKVAVQ